MDISIDPELRGFIDELIRAGRCNDEQDAVRMALERWREDDLLTDWDAEELREAIQKGVDQAERGESEPWDAAKIKADCRRRAGEQRN